MVGLGGLEPPTSPLSDEMRRKSLCRALAVHEIDADVRGRGLGLISRRGSTRGCGDAPSAVLCDGIDDTGAKNAIRSDKQDMAFLGECFRSSGHDNPFQAEKDAPRLFRSPSSCCKPFPAFVCHYRVEASDSDRCS